MTNGVEGKEFTVDRIVTIRSNKTKIALVAPDVDDSIQCHLRRTGTFYESDLLDLVAGLSLGAGLVLDVGANIGNHALFFVRVMGRRVHVFEPQDHVRAALIESISLNEADDRVTVHALAVGQRAGTARLYKSEPGNLGSASTIHKYDDADNGIAVRVVAIDELHLDERVALIKIDAEGADHAVLMGAQETLEKDRPVVTVELDRQSTGDAILRLMEEHRYIAIAQFGDSPTFVFQPEEAATEERRRASLRSMPLAIATLYEHKRYFLDRSKKLAKQLEGAERERKRALSEKDELVKRLAEYRHYEHERRSLRLTLRNLLSLMFSQVVGRNYKD